GGRLDGWLIRRPGWQLALFYWTILGLPPLVDSPRAAHAERHVPSAGLPVTGGTRGPTALIRRIICSAARRHRMRDTTSRATPGVSNRHAVPPPWGRSGDRVLSRARWPS